MSEPDVEVPLQCTRDWLAIQPRDSENSQSEMR